MNYIEVYNRRAFHMGTTPQERALNSGILEFRRYLKYNPHTVRNLLIEKTNTPFDGVILTDKEDNNRVSQILLTELNIPIRPGSLILWNNQHWIVYQTTTSSYQPYQKFYMVRCNYYIKWVDEKGALQGSWIYLLGSKDSKIQDNFRTWHNMITPQPNKHINILLPYVEMKQGTEIVVQDEVWYLVDYDLASVPGIIFMSFTETNVNEQRDNINESIANVDKLAEWAIQAPTEIKVAPQQEIIPEYYVSKNGILQKNIMCNYSISGDLTIEDGKIYAGKQGTGTIKISYLDEASFEQKVIISSMEPSEPMLLGDEKVRLTGRAEYVLQNAAKAVEFSISDEKLAVIVSQKDNSCTILANDKNKIGEVILTAYSDEKTYTKNIQIVSLWQVI